MSSSDEPFPVPKLVSALRARNLSRHYKGFAESLRRSGFVEEADRAEKDASWWMQYSISLSQTPPGAIDRNEIP